MRLCKSLQNQLKQKKINFVDLPKRNYNNRRNILVINENLNVSRANSELPSLLVFSSLNGCLYRLLNKVLFH